MEAVATRSIPMLDLQAQHRPIRDEVLAEVIKVIDSQRFGLGPETQALEREVAAYCGARHAIGCANGSDALLLALLALDIQPDDEVLTVPFTFFATAGSVARAGARPVFVDVDPVTFNMDVAQVEQALAAHPRIKAIIPVHLYGACADMDPLCETARAHGVAIIEDFAQAIGSEYKGRRAGGIGDIGTLSFYPTKNLGAYGDAGMLTTNDDGLAKKLASLREHGCTETYFHRWVGFNSRLDAIQAAALHVKFRYLDGWTAGRQQNAALYTKLLRPPVIVPAMAPHTTRHIFHQFVIRCPQRDALRAHLKQAGVGTAIYYPLALHLQECFAYLGYKQGDFPVSEQLTGEVLALPVYAELTPNDIEYVAAAINGFF
jgi:dTDP-4-amino-4,6-dideoxygalactose transaminase